MVARAASDLGLLVEGERTVVVGSQRGPLSAVHVDGEIVAQDVAASAGAVANVLTWPGMARRERIGGSGVVLETIVAAPALPFVAVQWRGHPGEVSWTVPTDGHGGVEVRVDDEGVVEIAGDLGWRAVGAIVPAPATVRADPSSDPSRITVLVEPAPDAAVTTLVLTGGDPETVRSALAASRHLTGHALRATRPETLGGLALATGIEEIDEGVQWARVRLRSAMSRALRLGGADDLRWAAIAAEIVGDPETAREGREAQHPLPYDRRLPMVGAPPSLGAWIEGAVGGEPGSPTPTARSAAERAICELAALARRDPDEAWTRWRSLLASGYERGPFGPATWDDPLGGDGVVAPTASALLVTLAHGILGLSQDEDAGRIRIAPRFASHLTTLRVEGITLGRAEIALSYERREAPDDTVLHHFVIEPTNAAVPPTAIFEPGLPGRLAEARIDGRVATLDPVVDGERTVVPVQLPVDARRTVELRVEGQPPSTSM